MKLNNIISWLSPKVDLLFPDRQLYFRTNGEVRFVTISQNKQILSSVILIGIICWFSITTYSHIYINDIINDKNIELSAVNSNYEILEKQYNQLKDDIQSSSQALEQRQNYLEQILDVKKVTIGNIKDIITDDKNSTDNNLSDTSDKRTKNLIRNEKLEKVYSDLKSNEIKQSESIKLIIEDVDSKLAFVKSTLTGAGLIAEELLELAINLPSKTQGGPLIGFTNRLNDTILESSEFNELYNKRSLLNDLELAITYLPTTTPPENYYLSSKFGARRDPFTKRWADHKGIDMAGWHKTPIMSGGSGVVVKAEKNGSFGLYVEIDHGNGFISKYGHLSKIKVQKGDKVSDNQIIGLMGSTGRSVSTHLHYEIWFNDKPIDPLKLIKAAKNVQKIKQQKYDS
ncbi:MAG: peptidoglycan DD-metalloendopeptidase family protein [Emcibacteraceae bacterium]|nr:peptidoglycan DD-metalloendopeptidase family protein [Emcibacteraceae bacterium]